MQVLRIALIAALATIALAGLGLAFAPAPDCTTRRCVYLPLAAKPEPTPTLPVCTPVPTEVLFVTWTPTVSGRTRAGTPTAARPCTPFPTETTEPPTTVTPTPSATPTVLAKR